METLTKEQRHEVYKLALKQCEAHRNKEESFFLCEGLRDSLRKKNKAFGYKPYKEIIAMFPEALSKMPVTKDFFIAWFDQYDYDSRAVILEQCIKETE